MKAPIHTLAHSRGDVAGFGRLLEHVPLVLNWQLFTRMRRLDGAQKLRGGSLRRLPYATRFGAQLRHHQIVDMHMGARADRLRRRPVTCPYLRTASPAAIGATATSCPDGFRLARGDIMATGSACGQPADRDRDVVGRCSRMTGVSRVRTVSDSSCF